MRLRATQEIVASSGLRGWEMGQPMSAGDQLCSDESSTAASAAAEPCCNTFLRQKGAGLVPVLRQTHIRDGAVWPPRTREAPDHGKESHELQSKDRGWVLEWKPSVCYHQLQVVTRRARETCLRAER